MSPSPATIEMAARIATAFGRGGNPAAPVSMPVSDRPADGPAPWAWAEPFGLFGDAGSRQFRRQLRLGGRPGDTLELLAMCPGKLVKVPAGYLAGPGRRRVGASHLTERQGLMIEVSPIGPVLGRLQSVVPATVLELPDPKWIVYEFGELDFNADPAVSAAATWEILDEIPISFPTHDAVGIDAGAECKGFDDLSDAERQRFREVFADLPDATYQRFNAALEPIADRLAGDPLSIEVLIEGHTDTTGQEGDNDALSCRRAEMIRQHLIELILERDGTLEKERGGTLEAEEVEEIRRDWEAVLKTVGHGQSFPWYVRDADAPRRAANRRVEILVSSPIDVVAGQRLGTILGRDFPAPDAEGTVAVTVIDGDGRLLDPLDLVRRTDPLGKFTAHFAGDGAGGQLPGHRLAEMRMPYGPAIASGWVHCLSAARTADATVDADRDFFFHDVGLGDDNPLAAVLGGPEPVEPGDVIWLPDDPATDPTVPASIPTSITIDRPISLVGNGVLTGMSGVASAGEPIVTVDGAAAGPIGVRVLGLTFQDNHTTLLGGAAIRVVGGLNVHLGGCHFKTNAVDHVAPSLPSDLVPDVWVPAVAPGGAVYLEACRQAFIEDCTFCDNGAGYGGALYAEDCQGLRIAGRPLAPLDEMAFRKFLADPDAAPTAETTPTQPAERCQKAKHYGTWFEANDASITGGAIALRNCEFRIVNAAFIKNRAGLSGGAIGAFTHDPSAVAQARNAIALNGSWPLAAHARGIIDSCTVVANGAPAGGGIAIGGQQVDLRRLVARPALPFTTFRETGSPTSGIFALLRNLIIDNGPDPGITLNSCTIGGGLCVASGVINVERNRFSGNIAMWGGGVACIGNARVALTESLFLKNRSSSGPPDPPDPPGDIGHRGGGAIYARGFGAESKPTDTTRSGFVRTGRTVVRLFGNRLLVNETSREGGAILATAGALVVSGASPEDRADQHSAASNLYEGNGAVRNGGAISVRNADLEVWAGERFVRNSAAKGDGGALFVCGGSVYESPTTEAKQEDARDASIRRGSSATGARLQVVGSSTDPVRFDANSANDFLQPEQSHGGAIFLFQAPLTPFIGVLPMPGVVPDPPWRYGNFSVGLLREVTIRNATFAGNYSDSTIVGSSIIGSTIALLGLDHAWRDDYRAPTGTFTSLLSVLDEILGDEPLGPYVLEQLDIQVKSGGISILINPGIGVYLMNSGRTTGDIVTVQASVQNPDDPFGHRKGLDWAAAVADQSGVTHLVVGEG